MAEEKKLTRAFICIEFPDEVIKEIARVGEPVNKVKFTGKLTELENLHLTLKFLGEIDDKMLEKVQKKLNEIKLDGFEAKLGEIGTFSYRGNPRIVWIKINGKEIWDLQEKIDDALRKLFKKEERFMSHLTIARVKYVKDKKGFEEHINGINVKPIKFNVNEFKLKSSELKKIGPTYKNIKVYKLKGEKYKP